MIVLGRSGIFSTCRYLQRKDSFGDLWYALGFERHIWGLFVVCLFLALESDVNE